jgi:hypothetical protein
MPSLLASPPRIGRRHAQVTLKGRSFVLRRAKRAARNVTSCYPNWRSGVRPPAFGCLPCSHRFGAELRRTNTPEKPRRSAAVCYWRGGTWFATAQPLCDSRRHPVCVLDGKLLSPADWQAEDDAAKMHRVIGSNGTSRRPCAARAGRPSAVRPPFAYSVLPKRRHSCRRQRQAA